MQQTTHALPPDYQAQHAYFRQQSLTYAKMADDAKRMADGAPLTEGSRITESFSPLMTRVEASALLRVAVATIIRYDEAGIITKRKVGGKVLYLRAEIMALIERKTGDKR